MPPETPLTCLTPPHPLTQVWRNATVRVALAAAIVVCVLLVFPQVPNALRWPARVVWLGSLLFLMATGVRTLRQARWSLKSVVFSCVLLAMMFAVTHLLCRTFMRFMGARDDRLALRGELTLRPATRQQIAVGIAGGSDEGNFHPSIGWVPRKGIKTSITSINEAGFRAQREYDVKPPERDKRVLCMGDSFTFGVGVDDRQTYPAHAEQLTPGWEWLNFGIPGACLTQAYLHYVENARKFDGKYVVIGFMTNDAQRTVNCYRPFVNSASGMAMTKPFSFVDEQGTFSIKPNPYQSRADYQRLLDHEAEELHRLLRQDYLTWGRTGTQVILESPLARSFAYACNQFKVPAKLADLLDNKLPVGAAFKSLAAGDLYGDGFWDDHSKGFQALCGMFDLFHATILKDGRIPLIVIIPGPHDVAHFTHGDPRQYQSLIRFLTQRNYRHLDFLDTLVAKHRDDLSEEALFVVRHYQGPVNRELAQKIIEMIPDVAPAAAPR